MSESTEPTKHTWKTYDEDYPEIDIFAFESGEYHNGPECVVCGAGFCHHCEPERMNEACPGPDGEPAEPEFKPASMATAWATAATTAATIDRSR